MEEELEKLEASETRYATELKNALKQYAEPTEQMAELYETKADHSPRTRAATLFGGCRMPTAINIIFSEYMIESECGCALK